ncbi:MAG: DUF4350 domain-containing protein [Pseudomonadota bacterium]
MERAKTLGWVAGILIIIALLIASESGEQDAPLVRPTTEQPRFAGVLALRRWLESAAIDTVSWQRRFDDLDQTVPGRGHVMIAHQPTSLYAEAEELAALNEWVAAGNTLLVAAGLLEGTPWIYDGFDLVDDLERMTGLRFVRRGAAEDGEEPVESPAVATDPTDDPSVDTASDAEGESLLDAAEGAFDRVFSTPGWVLLHGATDVVDLVAAPGATAALASAGARAPWDGSEWIRELSDATNEADTEAAVDAEYCAGTALAEGYRALAGRSGCVQVRVPHPDSWRTLLEHRETAQPVLFAAPLGDGQIHVLLHPSLLANDVIGRFENRAWVKRYLTLALGPQGRVLFDDAHQGLNTIYEAEDLLRDPRLYQTMAVILLLWLAFLLADSGHWRRATQRLPRSAVRLTDLATASAGFLARRLHPDAARAAILEPLIERLERRWRVTRSRALTDGLNAERRDHGDAVAALEMLLIEQRNGQRVPLVELDRAVQTLLADARVPTPPQIHEPQG